MKDNFIEKEPVPVDIPGGILGVIAWTTALALNYVLKCAYDKGAFDNILNHYGFIRIPPKN